MMTKTWRHRLSTQATLGAILIAVAAHDVHAQAPAPRANGHITARDSIAGVWLGALRLGTKNLRVGLELARDTAGVPRGTVVNLERGRTRRAIDSLVVDGASGTVRLVLRGTATFEGTLSSRGNTIAGIWRERGAPIPADFHRVDELPADRRPQEPRAPYPYEAHEVSFPNDSAGIRLAGTLTVPREPGRHPAVLLISGSGAQDRDETVFGHRPFLVLADYLTRRGIVVLRVDDRGVGGSGGRSSGSTTSELAGDAAAAVRFLASRAEIDTARIGLIGHSEGGLIAPMVALRDRRRVAFMVLIGAPGLPGDQLALSQQRTMLQIAGVPAPVIATQQELLARIHAVLIGEPDEDSARARVRAIMEGAAPTAGASPDRTAAIDAQLRRVMSPWFRYFLGYDPRPALTALSCPVLAVNGDRDIQVPAAENLAEIARALRAGRNADVTTRVLPGLNHLLQTAQTGAMTEYATIDETIAPLALATIGDWITARVRVP